MIKFVVDYPALFIPEENILVIADLHIGLESELYKSGIIIPPQAPKMQKQIERLIESTKVNRIVLLGDIKHIVPGMSFREEKEIPRMLDYIAQKIHVDVVPGNHDGDLKKILPKEINFHSTKGFKIGKYGFNHGHTWPSKELLTCDYLILGHNHPTIEFRDRLGYRLIERVWVKGKIIKEKMGEKYGIDKKELGRLNLIIIPAFNELLGGSPLNSRPNEKLLGPLLANKFVNIDEMKAYLLDGTYLGSIGNLRRILGKNNI